MGRFLQNKIILVGFQASCALSIPLVVDAFGLGVMVLPQVPRHATAEKAYWGSRLSNFISGFSSIFSWNFPRM